MKDANYSCVSRLGVKRAAGLCLALAALTLPLSAQQAGDATEDDDDVFELSPFEVLADEAAGYQATSTLAGTRLRTELRDVGTAISVLTEAFLEDLGATDNQSALAYATNMEVGGVTGNYQNAPNTGSWGQTDETGNMFSPNTNTRVRGLVSADNTRNYFRTTVAWDGYNVNRIDLLRGPNSILFGLGSPGGVINATTDAASVRRNGGDISIAIDEFGSARGTLNYNKVVIEDQLGVRLALLSDNQKFQQDPAYDDELRLYLAAKYKPAMLNSDATSFELSVDFERGDADSNRPRTAPPLDYLTAWIEPVSTNPIPLPAGSNYNGFDDGVVPAYTQFADKFGVTFLNNVNDDYPDAISGWADSFGPRQVINPATGNDYWRVGRVFVYGVTTPSGGIWTGNPQRARSLWGYGAEFQDTPVRTLDSYLVQVGHPFGDAFIPLQISDPTVYDFYNLLQDGPNKEEWNDFDQLRFVVSNTFLNNKLGYELSYFRENVTRGQTTFLSNVSRIFVDTQVEDIEGKPNPDFGRPFVQESTFGGNRINEAELRGMRASAFYDHDFASNDGDGWLGRLLGRHTLNAAYSEDEVWRDNRSFQRHVLGPDLVAKTPNIPIFNNRSRVSLRYYLGDSLADRSTVSGANIPNLSRYVIPEGGTINLRHFDTTWNAPGVDPSAPWVNPAGQTWEQAANPANYVGWRNDDFTIIDALSGRQEDLDTATRNATLSENEVESTILTWQGKMLDGLLVGTYGWREDTSSSVTHRSGQLPSPYNSANLDPEVYSLDNPDNARDTLEVQSRNFSAVAHLNQLPFVGDKFPLNISVSYNEGENFNPSSGRRDVNGDFIAPPQGSTEEWGVLLSTKNNRYSLRLMEYETAVLNSSSIQIPNANFRFNQFLSLNPRNTITAIESGDLRADFEDQPDRAWSIDDQENIHGPAWRQFEQDFQAAFPGFIDSWLNTGTWAPMNEDTSFSTAFVNTEDNVSTGYELEFTANPTDALRLTFNASRTEAERTNVPGASTQSVYEFIQNAMFNPDGTPTAAGAMRSGYDTLNDTMADFWYTENWIQYGVVRQLNGQPAPELIEWRANMLANYTFREGKFKGWGIGGAFRYESGNEIGFPYFFDENGTIAADVDNGYERGSNERIDTWLRYKRKLNDSIDWTIQFNLYNIFGDNELIPVRANPDGTFANYRIQQGTSWKLTNTFSF